AASDRCQPTLHRRVGNIDHHDGYARRRANLRDAITHGARSDNSNGIDHCLSLISRVARHRHRRIRPFIEPNYALSQCYFWRLRGGRAHLSLHEKTLETSMEKAMTHIKKLETGLY